MRGERDHCRCGGALPRRPRDIAAGRSRFSQACHAWQKIRPADRPHFAECPPFSWPRFAQAPPACGAPHREPPSPRLPNRAWIAGFACLRTSEPKLRRRFRGVCSVLDTGTGGGGKTRPPPPWPGWVIPPPYSFGLARSFLETELLPFFVASARSRVGFF